MNETINEIINLNARLAHFWRDAEGWAPADAANLMSKSRLDWQVSLSHCLKYWVVDVPKEFKEGSLILAWANLGSLLEGTLKLYLSVYFEDYKKDENALKRKNGILKEPDILELEQLKVFLVGNDLLDKDSEDYIAFVQQKRNAIHAYKNREIGSFEEFKECVDRYLLLLKDIDSRLPYP